jgi:hypothetical protein
LSQPGVQARILLRAIGEFFLPVAANQVDFAMLATDPRAHPV